MTTTATKRPPAVPGFAIGKRVTVLLILVWFLAFWLGGMGLDRTLLHFSYVGAHPWTSAIIMLTHFGDWEVLAALTFFGLAWLTMKRQWRLGLFVVLATQLGRLMISLQKIGLGRARPAEDKHLVDVTTLSFPSGHAGNSMIVYLMLALALAPPGRQRTIAASAAILLSLLIGASRSLLGVHWPSDVIGGWSFGILWVTLCLTAAQRWNWLHVGSVRVQ